MSTLNTEQSQQPQQTETLQLVDLQNLLAIIDIASTRGAFKGPELSQVGAVFDRVAKFLQSVAPKTEPQEQSMAESVSPTNNVPSPLTTASTPPFSTLGGSN